MDQACAFGGRPVLMEFDADSLTVTTLRPAKPLHLLIVDLGVGKDTRRLLHDLHAAYPFARTDAHAAAQCCLGNTNMRLVRGAADALRAGDAAGLGGLMVEAQREFDAHLRPLCPSQLAAPVLHRVLAYAPLQRLVWGGKGVGSGGDGSAQFVARSRAAQRRACAVIERDLNLRCLPLTIRP